MLCKEQVLNQNINNNRSQTMKKSFIMFHKHQKH